METRTTLVRIYLHEADQGRRANLMREILERLRSQHRVRHVTVFRGVAGFSEAGDVEAADLLRITANLPETIEFFDAPEVVEQALAALKDLVPEGHTLVWDAARR